MPPVIGQKRQTVRDRYGSDGYIGVGKRVPFAPPVALQQSRFSCDLRGDREVRRTSRSASRTSPSTYPLAGLSKTSRKYAASPSGLKGFSRKFASFSTACSASPEYPDI